MLQTYWLSNNINNFINYSLCIDFRIYVSMTRSRTCLLFWLIIRLAATPDFNVFVIWIQLQI